MACAGVERFVGTKVPTAKPSLALRGLILVFLQDRKDVVGIRFISKMFLEPH
jgi:hypothetical protein